MLNQELTYINLGVTDTEDATRKNYFSLFPEEIIASVLDAFIINEPMTGKVGGDGFWVRQEMEFLYIALFDCAGHGHLASMMTRIYTKTLDELVEGEGIKDPGEILAGLHQKLKERFQHKEDLRISSGADIGLLKINLSVREIEFAGAKTDLLHFIDGKMELLEADRVQTGDMFEYDRTYHTQKINLEDSLKANFYLSSDGLKDLRGGPKNKKLGKTGVVELLKENLDKPSLHQKEEIHNYMRKWLGSNRQPDDVLLIGFFL